MGSKANPIILYDELISNSHNENAAAGNEQENGKGNGNDVEVIDITDEDHNILITNSKIMDVITLEGEDSEKSKSGVIEEIDLTADSEMNNEENQDADDFEDVDDDDEAMDMEEDDDDDEVEIWDDDWMDQAEAKEPKNVLRSDDNDPCYFGYEKFRMQPLAPPNHHYYSQNFVPENGPEFNRAYQREVKILSESLPYGILVKAYEDKMNLFSAMIMGPESTPFENVPFAFDISLPPSYPRKPPTFHFISFTKDRVNPNLYVEGKVCVSLLGTWQGSSRCELWSKDSSLLQVLISIQGLILVPEPYFNEPGFAHLGNAHAVQAKNYNENVVVLLLGALCDMLVNPPNPWQLEITFILKTEVPKIIKRVQSYISGKLSPSAIPFRLLPFDRKHEVPALLTRLEECRKQYCLP